jgi:hypothetical protein
MIRHFFTYFFNNLSLKFVGFYLNATRQRPIIQFSRSFMNKCKNYLTISKMNTVKWISTSSMFESFSMLSWSWANQSPMELMKDSTTKGICGLKDPLSVLLKVFTRELMKSSKRVTKFSWRISSLRLKISSQTLWYFSIMANSCTLLLERITQSNTWKRSSAHVSSTKFGKWLSFHNLKPTKVTGKQLTWQDHIMNQTFYPWRSWSFSQDNSMMKFRIYCTLRTTTTSTWDNCGKWIQCRKRSGDEMKDKLLFSIFNYFYFSNFKHKA